MSKKVTDVIAVIVKVALIGIIYGYYESYLYDNGFMTNKELFGVFSVYHLYTGFWLAVLTTIFNLSWHKIPLAVLSEDIVFYVISNKHLTENSWISELLGSFTIGDIVIPWAYILLIALWMVFEIVEISNSGDGDNYLNELERWKMR